MSKKDAFYVKKNNKSKLVKNEQTDVDNIQIKTENQDWDIPIVMSPYFNTQIDGCHIQNTKISSKEKVDEGKEQFEVGGMKREIFEDGQYGISSKCIQSKPEKQISKKRKLNRFGELTEEEVAKKLLPDHLKLNLDIVIVGINPGLISAYKGHHYVNPCNHFWKCLYLSGMINEPLTGYDDYKLLDYGIGFTNIVARTTKSSSDLKKQEIKEGAEILVEKLKKYKPKIAVFNGKGIYEVFSGRKDFMYGKQSETILGTDIHIWVMPSSSPRYAQLPTAFDKLIFYSALKKFRDVLNGNIKVFNEEEFVFPTKRSTCLKVKNIHEGKISII
ncbi:unnamed protein product [Meganyctiphanes norvegica]|uniref:G/T mismatch-specific thymine DNA glycosylase n=1 Tax=Meganyctiphanes norvegica TaxID=48144 RepID=A0AAV2SV19_MEGNR